MTPSRPYNPEKDIVSLVFSFGAHPSPLIGTQVNLRVEKLDKLPDSSAKSWAARISAHDQNAMSIEVRVSHNVATLIPFIVFHSFSRYSRWHCTKLACVCERVCMCEESKRAKIEENYDGTSWFVRRENTLHELILLSLLPHETNQRTHEKERDTIRSVNTKWQLQSPTTDRTTTSKTVVTFHLRSFFLYARLHTFAFAFRVQFVISMFSIWKMNFSIV